MHRRRTRRQSAVSAVLAAVVAVLALAGCGIGIGAGPGTKNANIQVTRNFGTQVVGTATEKQIPTAETEMSLLQKHFKVSTSDGGGFVDSINGHSGSGKDDWFYYINGILAPKGAAVTNVHKGDHVWWDLHDWTANPGSPAIVGSFPEPFTNGIGGQEFPTLLDCAGNTQKACDLVGKEMHKFGVKVGFQGLGTGSGSDSLAVVVGTWNEIQGVIASELIGAGPKTSGVYAQFVGSKGLAVELDNPKGDIVRTLYGDTGLIAATEQPGLNEPTWLVTGTTTKAVMQAARAVTPADLHNHFAVVVSKGHVIPVPLQPGK
jgi:Domain of unknown function (DUF4430)